VTDFGVVVVNPYGKMWIEGPHSERESTEISQLFRAFGCQTAVLPMNYTELPIGG
jgi:hypothetical protein